MSAIKPRTILSAFMLVAGLTILCVGCLLFSWDAKKESGIFFFIGAANVLGAWRLWRTAVTAGPARNRLQQIALASVPALTVYLAAYVFLGIRICGFQDPQNGASYCGFMYRYRWEAELFIPAAAAESLLLQRNIGTGTEDELTWSSPVREAHVL